MTLLLSMLRNFISAPAYHSKLSLAAHSLAAPSSAARTCPTSEDPQCGRPEIALSIVRLRSASSQRRG